MSHKQILVHSAAREKVLRGATALADTVRVTLGPKSKSVLIGKKWGNPIACNDGVTIAKEFDLKDPEENLGAQMIRQAAVRTGDAVGDGTTTSTLLAHAIYAEGLRNIAAGASAVDLKRGLERGLRTAVEVVQGMQFDRGYLSPYFVTDPERMECVLQEPLILVHDKRIGSMKGLLPVLEHVAKEGQTVSDCRDFSRQDPAALALSSGGLPCPFRSPLTRPTRPGARGPRSWARGGDEACVEREPVERDAQGLGKHPRPSRKRQRPATKRRPRWRRAPRDGRRPRLPCRSREGEGPPRQPRQRH